MQFTQLALQNFRNFSLAHFDFEKTTLLFGPNGIGKTSVLEAIQVLATGESFRANKVEEMLRLDAELGRVQGLILEKEENIKLEVMLTRGQVQGKRSAYRLFSVNDVRRSKKNFLGNFATVVFRPEDLRLVEGSPERRRNFLDTALAMTNQDYRLALGVYEQTLRRRNRLLQKIAAGEESAEILSYWNASLLKNGQILQRQREQFIDFIREVVFPFTLNISYEPSWLTPARLAEHQAREQVVGHSLIGPHKDDFLLKFSDEKKGIDDLSILAYGSRGQQRLAVLWLKIAELHFLKDKIGFQPLLLLDDIFSELDEMSKAMVLSLLSEYQSIVSTADESLVKELQEKIPQLRMISLSQFFSSKEKSLEFSET